MSIPDGSLLYLSEARGIYIPRDFATDTYPECISGVSAGDMDILQAGPDHEWYWEAWESVLNNAVITARDSGKQYTVYQDGDCWLVPVGAEWQEDQP